MSTAPFMHVDDLLAVLHRENAERVARRRLGRSAAGGAGNDIVLEAVQQRLELHHLLTGQPRSSRVFLRCRRLRQATEHGFTGAGHLYDLYAAVVGSRRG